MVGFGATLPSSSLNKLVLCSLAAGGEDLKMLVCTCRGDEEDGGGMDLGST